MIDIYPTIYKIPISYENSLETGGASIPIIVRVATEDSFDTDKYVVKLYKKISYEKHGCLREMVGSKLAIYFDIETPPPAVMELTSDFCHYAVPAKEIERIKESLGYNFSSEYIQGATLYQKTSITHHKHREAAAKIFAFDLLLLNYDRSDFKPNLFFNQDGFIVFDHEKAFPYSKPGTMLGGVPFYTESLIFRSQFKSHILYNELARKKDNLIESFLDRLSSFTNALFDDMLHDLPQDWITEDVEQIRSFLIKTSNNVSIFSKCYKEVLA